MLGFELGTCLSDIGSDHSVKCATAATAKR